MDIEGILKNQSEELLEIDLCCLEEELDTGGYSATYTVRCKNLISAIRNKKTLPAKKVADAEPQGGLASQIHEVPLDRLSPFSTPLPSAKSVGVTADDLLWSHVLDARRGSRQRADLIKLLENERALDERFVEVHIGDMTQEELCIFLEHRNFSEPFLDRYFSVLDSAKVGRFQLFSEEFFIKHFSEMNPTIVLKQGKNPWRRKEARSKKLDTFLRIKGVRF